MTLIISTMSFEPILMETPTDLFLQFCKQVLRVKLSIREVQQ